MSVFWDTSGVIAFLRADDPHHEEAVACVRRLERERERLVLTNFIFEQYGWKRLVGAARD